MKLSPRTLALTGVKLLVLAGLLALVSRQVQWHDLETVTPLGERNFVPGLATVLRQIDLAYYGLALLAMTASVLFAACRWHRLLLVLNLPFGRWAIVKLAFIGGFFNNFLLGSLGGDAVKVYLALKNQPRKTAILTSIFADRLIGLIGLTVHAAIMLGFLSWQGKIAPGSLWLPVTPLALIGGGVTAGAILLFSTRLHRLFRLGKLSAKLPMGLHLQQATAILRELFANPIPLLSLFAYTLGCQLTSIAGVALIGASLHLTLAWPDYLLYVPIIFLLSVVPITPGGLGVLEGLCLIYLAAAGNPNQVLILALLLRLTILLASLPGLFAFWSYGHPTLASIQSGLAADAAESEGQGAPGRD